MKNNKKLTLDEMNRIIAMYLEPKSILQVANYFHRNRNTIKNVLKKFNISFHSRDVQNSCMLKELKNTMQDKYGVDNAGQMIDHRDKVKNTCLIRYGDANYTNRDKAEKTNLKRYGVSNVFSSEIIKDNIKKTNLERYGSEYTFTSDVIRDKIENTMLDRYGEKHYSKTKDFKKKIKDKMNKSLEKRTITNLERYGVENVWQSEEIKSKSVETCLKKYNKKYYSQTDEYQKKQYATKKKNNSFNKSSLEDKVYIQLVNKYGKDNVLRQYKSDKYPFVCDFYILSEDLYIEFNGTWTHGGRPFDKNDESCQKQLKEWQEKAKTSKYYQNAVYTWTDLDVRKRKCAEDNHLNYIVQYKLIGDSSL